MKATDPATPRLSEEQFTSRFDIAPDDLAVLDEPAFLDWFDHNGFSFARMSELTDAFIELLDTKTGQLRIQYLLQVLKILEVTALDTKREGSFADFDPNSKLARLEQYRIQ